VVPLKTIQVFSYEHLTPFLTCFSIKGRNYKIVPTCNGQLKNIPGAMTWTIHFIDNFCKNLRQTSMLLKELPLFLCREQLSRVSNFTSSYFIHKGNVYQRQDPYHS